MINSFRRLLVKKPRNFQQLSLFSQNSSRKFTSGTELNAQHHWYPDLEYFRQNVPEGYQDYLVPDDIYRDMLARGYQQPSLSDAPSPKYVGAPYFEEQGERYIKNI